MKTCFLAGRAMRISHNSVMAVARAPVRVAAWTKKRVVYSARLLNPFNWRKRATRRLRRKSIPAAATRPPSAEKAQEARPPSVRAYAAPPEVTPAEASAAVFASARDTLIFSRALEEMAGQDPAARARVVRTLGGIPHELSVRALSARLARDPSAEVRRECVDALTALGIGEGLPAVERALSDTSGSVRLAAVRGVYRLAGLDAASSLIRMFSDEHEDVRRRAAACVGWLGKEHLAVELLPLLKDESVFVRRTALDALGTLDWRDAASEVVGLLDDPEESVRKKALDVFETITGEQLTETLPDDENGRQVLIALWRAQQEKYPRRKS